jgi:hypothetical protein
LFHLFHIRTIENITRILVSASKASAAIQFSNDRNPFFLNLVMKAHAQLFVFAVPSSSPRVHIALWSKNQLRVSMSNSSVENTIIALENTMSAMAEIRVIGSSPSTTISYSKWLQVACELGKGLLQQLDPFAVDIDINTSSSIEIPVIYSRLPSPEKKKARECLAKG